MSVANCPRCGARAEDPPAHVLDPTFRPEGPELVLRAWLCAACGTRSVLAEGSRGPGVVELTGALLRRATAVSRDLAEEVAPDRRVAGHLRPGWLCQAASVLDGRPAFPPSAMVAAEAAVDSALDRLRAISWEPTLGTEQSEPLRRHFGAIAAWVRAVGVPGAWSDVQPAVLVRDDAHAVAAARVRLEDEAWYVGLPGSASARRDLVYWFVWLELDARGDVPVELPDPYEPLIQAFEVGGVVLSSRELRNEIHLGSATMRLPESVDDWPTMTFPPRRSLYVRDC